MALAALEEAHAVADDAGNGLTSALALTLTLAMQSQYGPEDEALDGLEPDRGWRRCGRAARHRCRGPARIVVLVTATNAELGAD